MRQGRSGGRGNRNERGKKKKKKKDDTSHLMKERCHDKRQPRSPDVFLTNFKFSARHPVRLDQALISMHDKTPPSDFYLTYSSFHTTRIISAR